MIKAARISFSKMKKNIFIFGVINCIVYIVLIMLFRFFNLLHIGGLSMIDYVTLCLISLYQIHRWIKQTGGYVPFLQVLCTIFFTGLLSFILLGGFIFAYSLVDPYLAELYFTH